MQQLLLFDVFRSAEYFFEDRALLRAEVRPWLSGTSYRSWPATEQRATAVLQSLESVKCTVAFWVLAVRFDVSSKERKRHTS